MEEDLEKTQILNRSQETPLTEPSEAAAAKTARLPRLDSGAFRIEGEKKEEEFRFGQSKILQKLAANAPLSEILKRLGFADFTIRLNHRSPSAGHALFRIAAQRRRRSRSSRRRAEFAAGVRAGDRRLRDWTKARFLWHCYISRRTGRGN